MNFLSCKESNFRTIHYLEKKESNSQNDMENKKKLEKKNSGNQSDIESKKKVSKLLIFLLKSKIKTSIVNSLLSKTVSR